MLPGTALARLSSSRQACVGAGVQEDAWWPRSWICAAYPTVGYVDEYAASAAVIVRIEAAADDSLLAILALSKFGIAITAMIKMMATTISSSIIEKPPSLRSLFPKVQAPR